MNITRSSRLLFPVSLTLLTGDFVTAGELTHGPFIGHVSTEAAFLWARLSEPGEYVLLVTEDGGGDPSLFRADAHQEDDLCALWHATHLLPATLYRYEIQSGDWTLSSPEFFFVTAPPDDSVTPVTMVFGSCAFEDFRTRQVWRRIDAVNPDVVVLLGDTPYIDTTDLAIQRQRYRAFLSVNPTQQVIRNTPFYATWDDHDFGRNDADGLLEGKENARRAFIEYHANPSYGAQGAGIYAKFRRGPVEVFLLDTRYFAATEGSPALTNEQWPGAKQPTLLGRRQWQWLTESLLASDARFKILACGMIWNGAVRPNKIDHWETYAHERDALFAFIGKHEISGVVLIGGDIHRSRVLRHDVQRLAGYDLIELITSPMHHQVIAAADVPHPGLIMDLGAPNSFLLLTVYEEPHPRIDADFLTGSGHVLFRHTLHAADLSAAPPFRAFDPD